MAASLPHRASALQSTLALSVGLHVVVVLLVRLAAPAVRREAPPVAPVAAVEVEMAEGPDRDVDVAVAAEPGREDRAQGSPPPAAPVPSPAPEPEVAPPPSSAPPPEPAPRSSPEPEPGPPHPRPPPERVPEPPTSPPPVPPVPPAPRPVPAVRQPSSPRPVAPASSAPASPSGAAPASAAPAPGEAPGDGGGFVRPRARDLAASFTNAIPPSSDAMRAWRTLPVGDAGRLEVELRTDEDGRVEDDPRITPVEPPAHLVDVVTRARLRMGRAPAALDAAGPGSGALRLRLTARIEQVAVPADVGGGTFDLSSTFRDGRGEARFTLQEGRRVTIVVEVMRVARDAR